MRAAWLLVWDELGGHQGFTRVASLFLSLLWEERLDGGYSAFGRASLRFWFLRFFPLKGRRPGLSSSSCAPPYPQSPFPCIQKLPPSGHFSRLAAGPQLFPVLIKTKMITLPSLPTVISLKFPAH